jgi:tetratricopeptide (TPR) repeat protein
VFDTGKFNCVSSSCLYYLVGTRLGLTLQPLVIDGDSFTGMPGHAAVDLVERGRRIEIEPTNPDGFDSVAKAKRPGVVAPRFQPDRKAARDCDGFGLAAAIASNQCINAAKTNGIEALRWGVIALTLDPTDRMGEGNVTAAVNGWALRLEKAKKYEDALAVFAYGRSALGPVKTLEHNYAVVWTEYLDAVFGAGNVRQGLELVPLAAAAFPKDKQFATAAEWVNRAARRKADKDGWAAGLTFAAASLKELPSDATAVVLTWTDSARRLWSQELLAKGDVAGSYKALADGLAARPDSKELADGLAYHAQTGLAYLDSKKGTSAAVEHFGQLVEAYPKSKGIRDGAFAVAERAIVLLEREKKFADAQKAVETYKPLAGDRATDLQARVFDRWGRSLADDGTWEAALNKYAEGLAAIPKSTLLRDNAIATADQWAFKAIKTKDWNVAIDRYDAGLKLFPDAKHLKDNRAYCVGQRDKK